MDNNNQIKQETGENQINNLDEIQNENNINTNENIEL